MTALFRRIPANTAGRDFAVGDIHGHFELLDRLLDGVGFDPGRDRLFSVGDLVDRGPESPRAAEFLDRDWFHALRGNHEQMLLDAAAGHNDAVALWRMNGGEWFFNLPADRRRDLHERTARLPVALEIECGRERVGLVHGDPGDGAWDDLVDRLTDHADPQRRDRCVDAAVWDRRSAYTALRFLRSSGETPPPSVAGVDRVLLGHTPMPCAVAAGNTRWLDTGAGHGRALTLTALDDERLWEALPGIAGIREGGWNEL